MTTDIEAAILIRIGERGPGKTICPSEAARDVFGNDPADWQPAIKTVRRVAINMAKRGEITIFRKGKPVADPASGKGVIRLGMPPGD